MPLWLIGRVKNEDENEDKNVMQVTELIEHPHLLNRDTLLELRRVVAQCPYYQAARLLLIENLFLLHDPDFDEELRTAALFVPDRTALFNLVESLNYESTPHDRQNTTEAQPIAHTPAAQASSRTMDIIGQFLKERPTESGESTRLKGHRPVASPIGDYTAVLEGMADLIDDPEQIPTKTAPTADQLPAPPASEPEPEAAEEDNTPQPIKEEYFTETLAKVFIKQGNYERALEILSKINAESPRKNAYYEDQICFLKKLILIKQQQKL